MKRYMGQGLGRSSVPVEFGDTLPAHQVFLFTNLEALQTPQAWWIQPLAAAAGD